MIELYQWAQMFYGRRSLLLVPYIYPFSFGTPDAQVLDGTTQSTIINISANADFIAIGLRHLVGSGSNDVTISSRLQTAARILLTDTASGEPFTNNATALACYSNGGLRETLFPIPRLLNGRSAINAQLSIPLTAEDLPRIEMALHGVLVRAWSDDSRAPGEGLFARDYR
jgi:hypothetical protein